MDSPSSHRQHSKEVHKRQITKHQISYVSRRPIKFDSVYAKNGISLDLDFLFFVTFDSEWIVLLEKSLGRHIL